MTRCFCSRLSFLAAAPGRRGLSCSLALSVVALLLSVSASTADNTDGALAAFAGDWDQVADERAEAARLANIDAATAELSWLVRKMASPVLRKSASPPPAVHFSWDGESLSQQLDVDGERLDRAIELTEPDTFDTRVAARVDGEGRPASVWRRHDDGRLEVAWIHEQARGATVFRLDDDGSLVVDYEIHVTALEGVAPIRYASRFERRSMPAVAAAPGDAAVDATAVSARR